MMGSLYAELEIMPSYSVGIRVAFLWVHELNATQKSHIPSPWLGTGVGQAAMDASSRP